ncbi:MAG: DUF2177 family protein [Agriterribacter sp.]
MKAKLIFWSWLPTFIILLSINGIFHMKIAAPFFDAYLHQLSPTIRSMRDADPVWIVLLDSMVSICMVYFITYRMDGTNIDRKASMISAALINFIAAVAWNFANQAMFPWSLTVTINDVLWHTVVGAGGGLLFFTFFKRLHNYFSNRK